MNGMDKEYEYDLFEKLPDGKVLWRMVVTGRDKSLEALRRLAEKSNSEFFAMYVPTKEIIATVKSTGGRVQLSQT